MVVPNNIAKNYKSIKGGAAFTKTDQSSDFTLKGHLKLSLSLRDPANSQVTLMLQSQLEDDNHLMARIPVPGSTPTSHQLWFASSRTPHAS